MRDFSKRDTAFAVLHVFLFAVAAALIAAFLLIWRLWGYVSLEQILFHFTVPLSGSFNSSLRIAITIAVAGTCAATALYAWFYLRCARERKRTAKVVLGATFAAAAVLAETRSGATEFIIRQFQTTPLFDSVPTRLGTQFSFPGQKRNLLVIHMESMEETFARADVMGANLIPELTQLQRENVSFSGFRQVRGTTWTTAGETGAALGLPLLLPIGHNDYGNYESFLPGALSIYEVLEKSGYALEFMFPNDCSFGGIENLIRTHSARPVIKDLRWFTANRPDAERQHGNNWGLRDRYLYAQLRQELALRAASDTPYAIFVETIDTHGPDTFYFLDPDTHAPDRFHDFRDVIRAGSLMMSEFIDWVRQQDFAKDLTIVILGDHLWMGDTIAGRDLGQNREVYNVFINPLVSVERPGPRMFCTPDFAPTILEAVGVHLPERRFGIGTSLFSAQPTVMERLGEVKFAEELGKTSKRYNLFFRHPGEDQDTETQVAAVNDFSAGGPRVLFKNKTVFMRSAPSATAEFVLINTTPAALAGDFSLRVDVLDHDGTPLPQCAVSVALPREMTPQDAELIQARIALPPPGNYTMRVSFAGEGTEQLPATELPMTVAKRWLYAGETAGGDGAAADESSVLAGALPCLVFPGQMEVFEKGGTLYFKLLDRDLSAQNIVLRGGGKFVQARALCSASGQTFRWAAASLHGLPHERIEAGLSGAGGERTRFFSLLPNRSTAVFRDENNLRAYIHKARTGGFLLLASAYSEDDSVCIAAIQGTSVLTMQTASSAPLHYGLVSDGSLFELNVYGVSKDAPVPPRTRQSLRVDGKEYAVSQSGVNLIVYDKARHMVIDRASFSCSGSLAGLSNILCGREDAHFEAGPATHFLASGTVPIERGAYVAAWPDGPYVTKYNGRLYFQTPWNNAFDIQLLATPESPFAPLEQAVALSPAGVISCIPAPNSDHCEIGFIDAAGHKKSVVASLKPLYLETNFCTYLRRLADPDLIVFISVLEEGARQLTDVHKRLFAALGLDMALAGKRYQAYVAVSDGGKKLLERCDTERIEEVLSAGDLGVRLISTGDEGTGFESSIKLDGIEYSAQSLGMNIVVYSKKDKRVIDSVCFNTFSDISATRKDPRFKRP